MIRSTPSNQAASQSTHWSRMRETGTLLGLRFLYRFHQLFGRGVFRFILVFVSIYFVLTRPEYRRASVDYLQTHYRHFPDRWPARPGLLQTFQHFMAFGETILDKALAWSTVISESAFNVVDRQAITDILNDKRGQLIIGTHLGNLEYCRGFMRDNNDKIINILIHDRHSANFARAMESFNPASQLHIYQVDEMDVAMILTLKSKIDNGEWLFIAGDRLPLNGHQRTVSIDFLGRPAAFPIGPYQLAMTLGCPVKLMFAYRQKQKITVELIPFCDKLELPRKERAARIEQYAERFARELEQRCKQVPLQWFNFYNFWAQPVQATATESLLCTPDKDRTAVHMDN